MRRPKALRIGLPDLPDGLQVSPEVLGEWKRLLDGVIERAVRIATDTLDADNETRRTQRLPPRKRITLWDARGGRK